MASRLGYTTVRISHSTRQTLREIAKTDGRSMQKLLEEAVEALRRKRFLEAANASYAALRADAQAWGAVEEERRAWDATLLDGLAGGAPQRAVAAPRRTKRRKAR